MQQISRPIKEWPCESQDFIQLKKKDYYKILGVDRSADKNTIKKAYHKLSKLHHPDKQQDASEEEKRKAEEALVEINEAYNILSNDDKRRQYDQFGFVGGNPNGFGGDVYTRHAGSPFGGFGRRAPKGKDVKVVLTVELNKIYNGEEVDIDTAIGVPCSACNGTGSKSGRSATCTMCEGTGMVTEQYSRGPMMMQQTRTCPQCGGSGVYITDPCPDCKGSGLKSETIHLGRRIITADMIGRTFVIYGQGSHAPYGDGQRGDVYVNIQAECVQNPEYSYDFEGNLKLDISVPLIECLIGGDVHITHLDGAEYMFHLDECTKDSKTLRLKGKGLPLGDGNRGDLLVTIHIRMPERVSDADKNLLNKLRNSENFK